MTESAEVREEIVRALRLDLIGQRGPSHPLAAERLPGWVRPSNWYLTGFLVPRGAPIEHRGDADVATTSAGARRSVGRRAHEDMLALGFDSGRWAGLLVPGSRPLTTVEGRPRRSATTATEDRRAAKKGFFPSSMGLSFAPRFLVTARRIRSRYCELAPFGLATTARLFVGAITAGE